MMASGLVAKRPPHILLLMARLPQAFACYDRIRSGARTPRQEAARHGRSPAASPASPSGWRRYTGSAGLQAMRRRRRPARPAVGAGAAAGAARRAARSPRSRSPSTPVRLPASPSRTAAGAAQASRRLARPHRAAQSVGHLVRALPQGDAGARRACRQSSAARTSRWSRSTSTPATPTSRRAWLKEVGISRLAYYADRSAKVFQDLKSMVARSGCRRRCWSIRPAASSARWPARPNGRATTRVKLVERGARERSRSP